MSNEEASARNLMREGKSIPKELAARLEAQRESEELQGDEESEEEEEEEDQLESEDDDDESEGEEAPARDYKTYSSYTGSVRSPSFCFTSRLCFSRDGCADALFLIHSSDRTGRSITAVLLHLRRATPTVAEGLPPRLLPHMLLLDLLPLLSPPLLGLPSRPTIPTPLTLHPATLPTQPTLRQAPPPRPTHLTQLLLQYPPTLPTLRLLPPTPETPPLRHPLPP
jgi:hypothetical protein